MKFLTKSNIWTANEDKVLEAGAKKYGKQNWFKISTLFRRKTAEQCRLRWKNFVDPKLNKQKFSSDEDNKILKYYKTYPNQWATISKFIRNRSPFQCKERFDEIVNQSIGIQKSDFEGNYEHIILYSNPVNLNKKAKVPKHIYDIEGDDFEEFAVQDQEMIEETKARLANSLGRKSVRKLRQLEMVRLKENVFDDIQIELEIAGVPLFHLEKEKLKILKQTQKYKKNTK